MFRCQSLSAAKPTELYSEDEENCDIHKNKDYFVKIRDKYAPKSQKKRKCCEERSLDMPRQESRIANPQVWERLLEDKRLKMEQREQAKRLQIESEQYPFRPEISQTTRRNTDIPIEDKLLQDDAEAKERKELMRREHLLTEQYTFKPKLNYKSVLKGDKLFQKPLYERIDEVIQQKQEELIKNQQEHSQESQFKPKISEKSSQLASQFASKSVIDRLMEDAVSKITKRMQQSQLPQPDQKECTFNPEINPTNDEARSVNAVYNVQYMMADFMKEKREKLIQEVMKASEYTFKPQINLVSELIVESNDDRINEKESDKFKRLGQIDYEKNKILKEQLHQAYYQQFTYKPQIDPISQVIARKRSLDNLAYNPQRQEKLKILQEEQELRSSNSFYPQTHKSTQYQHVKSKYAPQAIKENIQLELELKQRKIQNLKNQADYQQYKDCTFRPSTKEYKKDDEPAITLVKGFDKHLLNKENIKRQQEMRDQREKEVFHQELKYDFKNHLKETKPEPFKLSQQNLHVKRQLQEEAIQREKEQCTFKPTINRYM